MTPDEFARKWYEEVWNADRREFIDKHLPVDCTIHGLPPGAEGRAGFKLFHHGLSQAFENLHIEVLESVEQGNKTIGICRFTGLNRKTGANVDFCFGYSAVVENDQLVEARNVVDFLTMLQQCDVVKDSALASVI